MILGRILAALIKPLSWLVGLFLVRRSGTIAERNRATIDALKNAAAARDREDAAKRQAQADLAAGKSPEEIAREGDGKW